jgi:hypothetical protein
MNVNDELELQLWASRPFGSSEAEQAAFMDARYARSADFRNAVARKLALSNNGIAPVVHSRAPMLEVGGIGVSGTEAAAQLAEERKAAEQMLVEQHGPLAVAPPPVPVVRKSNEVISQWNRGAAGPTVRVLPDFYTK